MRKQVEQAIDPAPGQTQTCDCDTRSMGPGVSVARHTEVFVVAAGGVGELQKRYWKAEAFGDVTGRVDTYDDFGGEGCR